MKEIEFEPKGVCSRLIKAAVDDDGRILFASFSGGCAGNTAGISKLVAGMKIDDVISRLKGTKCGFKGTSCPDQLATALEELKNKND